MKSWVKFWGVVYLTMCQRFFKQDWTKQQKKWTVSFYVYRLSKTLCYKHQKGKTLQLDRYYIPSSSLVQFLTMKYYIAVIPGEDSLWFF